MNWNDKNKHTNRNPMLILLRDRFRFNIFRLIYSKSLSIFHKQLEIVDFEKDVRQSASDL